MSAPLPTRGFAFPIRRSGAGFPRRATEAESIRASLLLLLCTTPGERVMRPDLGARLIDLVFSETGGPLDDAVRLEILSVVGRYEPRVAVSEVAIERDFSQGVVTVTLHYIILRSGDHAEPLSLEFGGGT